MFAPYATYVVYPFLRSCLSLAHLHSLSQVVSWHTIHIRFFWSFTANSLQNILPKLPAGTGLMFFTVCIVQVVCSWCLKACARPASFFFMYVCVFFPDASFPVCMHKVWIVWLLLICLAILGDVRKISLLWSGWTFSAVKLSWSGSKVVDIECFTQPIHMTKVCQV